MRMKNNWIYVVLAVVFLGLGILFLPKSKPASQTVLPQTAPPSPVSQPKPPSIKAKSAIQLSGDSTWQIFLPQGSEWVNTDKQLIGEKGTPVYHPRRNAFRFTTDDWNGTYLVKAGSQVFTPNQRYFSISAEQGDCLSVYIKNISDHDLTLKMDITNYPYHYNPPTPCK